MSGEAALAVRSWPVGKRTCTLTVQQFKPGEVMNAVAEWMPTIPTSLSAAEWEQYRTGRNRALAGIAAELGVTMAVVEL